MGRPNLLTPERRAGIVAAIRAGAFQKAGRGLVVRLESDAEPRYVGVDEVKESLASAKVEPETRVGEP